MDPAKGSALGSRQGLCPCTPRRVFDPLDTLFAMMVSIYFAVRTREGWDVCGVVGPRPHGVGFEARDGGV